MKAHRNGSLMMTAMIVDTDVASFLFKEDTNPYASRISPGSATRGSAFISDA